MRARYIRNLLEAARRDRTPWRAQEHVWECLTNGQAKPRDFRVRELFRELVPDGQEILNEWESSRRNGGQSMTLSEAAGAVNTADFSNITGQVIYAQVLDAWNQPGFLADTVTNTVQTDVLEEETIPGISGVGDPNETVDEGAVYPLVGVSEERVTAPRKVKRGFIVPVTKEAIIADKTGVLLQRASDVATYLRVAKEKNVLNTVLGITTSYKRNGGAAQATYGNTHTQGTFDNLSASTALADWTDIQAAELLFDGMTDPNTGEPIVIAANQIIVPTALRHTLFRILNAIQVRQGTGAAFAADPTDNVEIWTDSRSPLANTYQMVTSQYVKAQTSSASTWFIGDMKKAFAYHEVWPITVEQAPTNSEAEFTQDIVSRFKVSEMGAPVVVEPRYAVKCTA